MLDCLLVKGTHHGNERMRGDMFLTSESESSIRERVSHMRNNEAIIAFRGLAYGDLKYGTCDVIII